LAVRGLPGGRRYERGIGDWLEGKAGYPPLRDIAGAIRERVFVPDLDGAVQRR